MEYYDLEEDEVVLYKGKVSLQNQKGITELILTNINFVLITKQKKLFSKEQVSVETYAVNEIKCYNGNPQVIKKGNLIELYFLNDETYNIKVENEEFSTSSKVCTKLGYLEIAKSKANSGKDVDNKSEKAENQNK